MKISFATSFLVSVVLTSTAVSARATEESIDDHSSPTSTKVISLGPTDTHFNFYTLWEKQFSNDDAKQLQMSMAISNGYVFVEVGEEWSSMLSSVARADTAVDVSTTLTRNEVAKDIFMRRIDGNER